MAYDAGESIIKHYRVDKMLRIRVLDIPRQGQKSFDAIDMAVYSKSVFGMFAGVEGEYRVKNVKVGGEDLVLDKTYTVASHNYMLKNGGDGFNMFMNCNLLQDEVMIDNQVLINYITGTLGGVVGEAYAEPYGQGRIVAVPEKP